MFSTAFVAPKWFRFEYDDKRVSLRENPWPRCHVTVWNTPTASYCREHDDVRSGGLESLLFDISSSTHKASLLIPSLVLPKGVIASPLLQIQEWSYAGIVSGNPTCHVVHGYLGSSKISLWIGVEDLLIRKVIDRSDIGRSHSERAAAIQELRFDAAGIPVELRPAYKMSKPADTFKCEVILSFNPEKNVALDCDVIGVEFNTDSE